MRMNNHFHINGFALIFISHLGYPTVVFTCGRMIFTRAIDILRSNKWHFVFLADDLPKKPLNFKSEFRFL